jgi:hypothetical protein
VPLDLNLAPLLPWSRQRLLVERTPVHVARMADLPPEADADHPAWEQMGFSSAPTLTFNQDLADFSADGAIGGGGRTYGAFVRAGDERQLALAGQGLEREEHGGQFVAPQWSPVDLRSEC